MRKLLVAAALLLAPSAAQAQYLMDGTTPGATTTLEYAQDLSNEMRQSFVARGTELSRITIWFYGGALMNSAPYTPWFLSYFQLGSFSQRIEQSVQGRYDINFGTPLNLVTGQTYTFSIYTDGCPPFPIFPCEPLEPTPRIGTQPTPAVEVTTTNAYAFGEFSRSHNAYAPNRDIRFEAAYLVPEPSTYALMSLGLLGIGVVTRRRRAR